MRLHIIRIYFERSLHHLQRVVITALRTQQQCQIQEGFVYITTIGFNSREISGAGFLGFASL